MKYIFEELIGETTTDIIFGSFNDTYQNLPKKTASGKEHVIFLNRNCHLISRI
jgi:spore coat polysaccharide biosynthesis predicted glycosyltransferase SpsG